MKTIDCLGDMCPVPILKTKAALKKLNSGESIKVVTDHSCVSKSLIDNFKKSKVTIHSEEVMNGVWEITITKD